MVDNFNREKDAVVGGTVEMLPEQEEYVDQLRIMVNTRLLARPRMPHGEGLFLGLRRQCFRIVMWDWEGAILTPCQPHFRAILPRNNGS